MAAAQNVLYFTTDIVTRGCPSFSSLLRFKYCWTNKKHQNCRRPKVYLAMLHCRLMDNINYKLQGYRLPNSIEASLKGILSINRVY